MRANVDMTGTNARWLLVPQFWVMMSACGTSTPPSRHASAGDPRLLQMWEREPWHKPKLSGRVTLHGKPVQFFGVILTKDSYYGVSNAEEPFEIHDADGRFAIDAAPGVWTLVVVGPGFARQVLRDISIGSGDSPFAIDVREGYALSGLVSDKKGSPIPGARVRVEQWLSAGSLLGDLARGNFVTTSDSTGHFEIENVSITRPGGRLFAQKLPTAASWPVTVPSQSASVDLVLYPIGDIKGTLIAGKQGATISAVPTTTNDTHLRTQVDPDGNFEFRDLPEGEYDLKLLEGNVPKTSRRVRIVGGQSTSVIFDEHE